jgi:hypothetical protein
MDGDRLRVAAVSPETGGAQRRDGGGSPELYSRSRNSTGEISKKGRDLANSPRILERRVKRRRRRSTPIGGAPAAPSAAALRVSGERAGEGAGGAGTRGEVL